MNVDELIAELDAIRNQYGGEVPVYVPNDSLPYDFQAETTGITVNSGTETLPERVLIG